MKFSKKFLSILLCVIMALGSIAVGGEGAIELVDALTVNASAADTLIWPVPGHTKLSQGYHDGNAIDISDENIKGATVVAACKGTVYLKKTCSEKHFGSFNYNGCKCQGFGTGLVIKGDDGRFYSYGHMESGSIPSYIKKDAKVEAGAKIGKVGTTGNSSGYHLHFAIAKGTYTATGINPSNENYIKNQYSLKVYYNANGGTVGSSDYYLSGTKIFSRETSEAYYQKWTYNNPKEKGLINGIKTFSLSKPGYTFLGWGTSKTQYEDKGTYFDDNDTDLVPSDFSSTICKSDTSVTMYAQWVPNKLTVYYDANGGVVGSSDHYLSGTKIYRKETSEAYCQNWKYNEPKETGLTNGIKTFSLSKPGYTFLGWGTTKTQYEDNGTYFDDNDTTLVPSDFSSTILSSDASVTMYAQWKANTYTITFNANGGSTPTASKAVTYGSTYGTLPTPTYSGYVFNGWFTAANGGTQIVADTTVSITAEQTLYAHWTAITLSSITVKSNPTKTSYYVGDTLNTTGLTLIAKYSDNSTETILSGFTCSPVTLNAAGSQSITVSYGGKITSFNVTVTAVAVTSITIKTEASKKSFYVGDSLNTAGLTLTANYNNGTSKTITTGYTATADLNTIGAKLVMVSYGGQTVTYAVNVEQIPVLNHAIIYKVDGLVYCKLTYAEGETIEKTVEPSKSGYDFIGWNPSVPLTMQGSDITVDALFVPKTFVVDIIVDGQKIGETRYTYGDKELDLSAYPVPKKYGYIGEWYYILSSEGATVTAVYTPVTNPTAKAVLKVAPAQAVDYRSIVTITATATDVAENCKLELYVNGIKVATGDNKSVSYSAGELKTDLTYSVVVVDNEGNIATDGEGNELRKDGGKITVNAGFFKKLVAFFKGLFKKLPTVAIKP